MSDVRKVDVWDNKYLPEIGDGSFVSDDDDGTHALLPWAEWERQQAEIERLRAKIDRQRDRIVYLEGATNHATGTPLTKARDRADRAEARLRAVVEVVDRHQHWTDQTTVTQLIDAADYEPCETCKGTGIPLEKINGRMMHNGDKVCPDCINGWRPRGEDDE